MSDLINLGNALIKFGSGVNFPQGNFCLGYWENKTAPQKDKVTEKKIFGNRNWILDWRPYLIDMTPVEGETAKVPVAELKKDNWLRKIDGSYATVVGITESQATCCDRPLYWIYDSLVESNQIYIGDEFYDAEGHFKPDVFWEYCKENLDYINENYRIAYGRDAFATPIEVTLTNTVNTVYKYGNYSNVGHIVAPWETTNENLSVYIGRPDDVYLIDRVVGDSGKEWTGILANDEEFDGIDVSFFKLARTGISPTCSTAKFVNGRFCLRNFFYNYASSNGTTFSDWGTTDCSCMAIGSDESNDEGSTYTSDAGKNNSIFYANGHYPISMYKGKNNYGLHLKTSAIYARNNNFKQSGKSFVDSPVPVSEGGYHSNNTFICCMEVAFGTKHIHDKDMFGIGISSTYPCSNEEEWDNNGGVKYTYSGTTYYKKWSETCAYNSSYHWSNTMNSQHAKFQCNEPQIAASLMTEMGLTESDTFVWNGGTWNFKKPTAVDARLSINSLGEGEMNCRIYKKINFTPSSYQSYNVTLNLVCGLTEGVSLCGDIIPFTNGGCELVCISNSNNSSYPSYPVVLNVFLETDQSKWHTEDFYTKKDGSSTTLTNYFYLPSSNTFAFEANYKKIVDGFTTSGYARRKGSYAPCAIELIAGYASGDDLDTSGIIGDCFYNNTRINDYSQTGANNSYRHRRTCRIGGNSLTSSSSPRSINALGIADSPWFHTGCLTQVLLTE